MIDINARRQLSESKKTETLVKGMKESVIEAVKGMKSDNSVDDLKTSVDSRMKEMQEKTESMIEGIKTTLGETLAKNQDLQNVAKMPLEDVFKNLVKDEGDKKLLEQLVAIDSSSEKSVERLDKIGQALAMIFGVIKKPFDLPKIFNVQGRVEVSNPLRITNFSDLEKYFKSLEQRIITLAQASSTAPAPQIKMPDFPKIEIPKIDNSRLEDMIEKLVEKIEKIKPAKIEIPKSVEVSNFPPQYIPTPVTNFSLNPLQGYIKTTSSTVGTTLTKLPSYGQLNNRRAVQVYNNSDNTIYIGGSDVTTSNGIPVAPNSFSQSFDAGYNMILYGIANENNNVRVIELSRDQSDTVQQ